MNVPGIGVVLGVPGNTFKSLVGRSVALLVTVVGGASVAYAQGDKDNDDKTKPTMTAPTTMIVCEMHSSDTESSGEPVKDEGCREVPVDSDVRKPKFKYKVNVRPPPGQMCTRETPTGSRKSEVVCRSPQQAYLERRAAQEQLKETIRDGR